MMQARLLAAGLCCYRAEQQPADLLALLHQSGGPRLRRSNRYIALSLLGARACVQDRTLDQACGVYLGSSLGNIAETTAMMAPVVERGEAPMPFSFINVSSNMAGFTLAQQFSLHGRNLAVARYRHAFVSALELAMRDLQGGRVSQALVGAVDECVWPLNEHRQRLGLPSPTPLIEGSGWLLLSRQGGQDEQGMGSLQWQRYGHDNTLMVEMDGLPHAPDHQHGMVLSCEPDGLVDGFSPARDAWQFIAALAQAGERPVQAAYRLAGDACVGLRYLP